MYNQFSETQQRVFTRIPVLQKKKKKEKKKVGKTSTLGERDITTLKNIRKNNPNWSVHRIAQNTGRRLSFYALKELQDSRGAPWIRI